MAYQVGDLVYYAEDDPEFETLSEAEAHAIKESAGDAVIGVWTSQAEGSDLVSIAYDGELFRKTG